MNILNKMKKILYGVGTSFVMIPVKIYAAREVNTIPVESLYGVPSTPEPKTTWVDYAVWFIQFILIPVLLLIGAIVLCKNLKCRRWIKIIIIGIFVAIMGIYIGYITSNF